MEQRDDLGPREVGENAPLDGNQNKEARFSNSWRQVVIPRDL